MPRIIITALVGAVLSGGIGYLLLPVLRALKAGTIAKVYVANDSDTFLYQRVTRAAEEAGVPAIRIETMKELGEACCVAVPTAAAGILK